MDSLLICWCTLGVFAPRTAHKSLSLNSPDRRTKTTALKYLGCFITPKGVATAERSATHYGHILAFNLALIVTSPLLALALTHTTLPLSHSPSGLTRLWLLSCLLFYFHFCCYYYCRRLHYQMKYHLQVQT